MPEIRPSRESDWIAVWRLLRAAFAAGETYSVAPDIFDFVVTSARAVRPWRRLRFRIVGRLTRAFRHRQKGFVDARVMFRTLVPYHSPP
jgi:hypothetical protein